MTTRSLARSNNILQGSSSLNELKPVDKENVHPVTGEHAGVTATSKKRKTNVLLAKTLTPLTTKKVKSAKEIKDARPQSRKRKATSETEESKGMSKKEGTASGTSRKPSKWVMRKVSKLPRLEEEAGVKGQETISPAQAAINSRCKELTVKPLANISQAYDTIESVRDASASSPSKVKFQKDTSAEPEIRDFFPSSQTLASLASTSTARAPSSEPPENRKFSTPELKEIYAAFTFSSPSPTSKRVKPSLRP